MAILLAPETLRVYRRLRQRLQGCCDPFDIPALLNACVAAAEGCDRAARSWRSLLTPETLRVYRRLRQRLQGCCEPLDIPA
ncbi:MAG: hypothetical protein AAAB21_23795, partial [Pseudomonas chlororaphis]